ncbi:(2Fe-2S)-binding protein [Youngiibacter fragilis]|uniref:BFD-like (2Fe-2S) protein n=1 Tax=Youngiibacter fragilis 232.1 TaxID=994573 RepID=V7I279_9CLOT|nr:(2Fe-2S)-binding protein [Youngiibacter fragilis]ETA79289.1 BFD-like (2Fe-2S) protein [Youngiibacter fragilis 232.1]
MKFLIGNSHGSRVLASNPVRSSCPVCGNEGTSVGVMTVEHLVTDRDLVRGEKYRTCMNEDCDVVYFDSDNGSTLTKNQVIVPIWFKRGADPKYACYCSQVTEAQVIEAVEHGARTVSEVNAATGAMKNSNCKKNNPLGVCCHKIIQEVLDRQELTKSPINPFTKQ